MFLKLPFGVSFSVLYIYLQQCHYFYVVFESMSLNYANPCRIWIIMKYEKTNTIYIDI